MKKAFLILCLLGVPIFGYGASTNVSDLPLKTAPIANDSAIINDTQDINATTGRSESKRALLGSLPVSTAQQAAIDLKANKAGAVLLWSEWANGATFTTASPMVVYNGTLYKCIAPYAKVSGETPDTQTGYFSEVTGGSSVSVPVATTSVSGTVKVGDRLTMTNGVLSADVQSGTVASVNSKTGTVVISPDDLSDTSTANKFVTSAEKTKLANLSGTNTGDQTTVTGNAGTSTALQTARTIGGVSFDGTANINLPGVNAAGNQNTTGTAAGLTAQYVDWSSSSGGSSIANKPSISGLATSSITGNLTIAKTGTTARTATFPDKAGTVAFTSDVPTGTAASVNTGTTVGTIPVFGDDGSGNPTLQYTLSLFDMVDGAGNPINPPSTTGYIPSVSTAGAVTWIAPGSGTFAALSDLPSGVTLTTLGYAASGATSNLQSQINAITVGSPVTTVPAYRNSTCTKGQYAYSSDKLTKYDCAADNFWVTSTLVNSLSDAPNDTIPASFTFTDATNATLSTQYTALAQITGIDTGITCTGSGGTVAACTGSTEGTCGTFGSTSGTITTGQYVGARLTSSASNSTAVDNVVVCGTGGTTDTFTATTVAGASYLVNTDFEGTGTPSGWTTEYGTPNYDYTTTALAGSQSIFLDSQYERASVSFTPSGTVSVHWVMQYSGAVSQLAIIEGTTSTEIVMADTGGDIRVDDAGGYRGSCTVGAVDTPIYVWFDRTKGTGANETKSVYVATTDTKPGSACVTVTNGTGTDDYTKFNFRVSNTGTTIIGDLVQVQ